jgi:hypothetical protein
MSLNNADALEQIQQLLSGKEWSPETLEVIAEIMRAAGYAIEELNPEPEED